ncbi:MAG: threonine/serine exporter family protein [Lachnospiraceae bacterium]|nr:threonine/serine exporter family protein [Lachnospiraceae bacterium]
MNIEQTIHTAQPQAEDIDFSDVLLVAMDAGHILLENGAEIFRVEETMLRIGRHFGVQNEDVFVLSNGIFTTGGSQEQGHKKSFARVQHIPMHTTSLDKVVAINQLSRDVEAGKYTLKETKEKLQEIREMTGKAHWKQILASGIGVGCFCLLIGGDLADAAAAILAGLLIYLFILKVSIPVFRLSRITENICGGALATLLCLLCYRIGLGHNLGAMVVGSIIPLVPGVAFTNSIRDIADRNYISGIVRMVDAILVFVCIAIGVGVVFMLCQQFGGGGVGL